HYRVFSSVYGPGRIWERFRTATPAIREYAASIATRLEGPGDAEIAVLSDETMLAYGGPELNAALLAYFLGAVRGGLSEPEALSADVVLTIREQGSYMQSFFAYVYTLQRERYRDFDAFVEAGLADPRAGVFGYLHYDDVLDFLTATLPPFVRVRVVPYELLAARGAAAFVEAFLGEGSAVAASRVDESLGGTMVNRSEDGYPLRDLARPRRRLRGRSNPQQAALSEEQRERVRALYAGGNRALAARLGLELGSLGYAL
ncbi:MAG: hypothetical protein ACRDLR_01695, partial [Gaiellaceae bacterium]